MNTQHTPGPWIVANDAGFRARAAIAKAEGRS
jgi:hypothetical protein